jgi:hypothetical protein
MDTTATRDAQAPTDLATTSLEAIMTEIYENGPVAATFFVCDSFTTFLYALPIPFLWVSCVTCSLLPLP